MNALLLEIKLSIGTVQGYVCVQSKATVKVHKSKLELTSGDNVTCNYDFKYFTIQPNSCKGLKHIPNEGLHFRMALGEKMLAKQHSELSGDEMVPRLLCDHVSFYCATCGNCITKALKFNRVLPLPSDNWQEICGNVFCHGNGNRLPTTSGLNPRADDCFINSTDYVLHSSVLQIKTDSSPYQATNVYCTRCNSHLGGYKMQNDDSKPSSAVVLSRHCVSVNNSSGHSPRIALKFNNRRWVENWIACHLVESSKENFCHRFIIKEQGNRTKNYACVWLLCPNTFILCNTYPEPSVPGDVWQNFSGQPENVQRRKNLHMYQTVKVLYKCEFDKDGKKLIDHWAVDSKVHSLYLQQQLCLLLLLVLIESNASLPPSLQCSNGFKNGYLRYSSEYE